jgi:hypothetical protein
LLVRLIRLDDEALAEFLTRYVGWALEVYVGAKTRARSLLPLNPLATAPFAATDAFARLVLGAAQWGKRQGTSPAGVAPPAPEDFGVPVPEPAPTFNNTIAYDADETEPPTAPRGREASDPVAAEIARLRGELEALKVTVAAKPRRGAKKKAKRAR